MIDFHTIKYILSMITRSYKETSTSCCCCFLNKPKRMCVCVKAWQSVRKRDRKRVQTMPNGQKNRKKNGNTTTASASIFLFVQGISDRDFSHAPKKSGAFTLIDFLIFTFIYRTLLSTIRDLYHFFAVQFSCILCALYFIFILFFFHIFRFLFLLK